MHLFEFAEKDATLYEGSATQSRNTGLDEILEVRKDMNADGSVVNVSRALIKFNLTNISESIVAGTIPENARYYLNLYDANSKELTTSQSLFAYPVSQSWVQGDGRFFDQPATTDGCSWRYRDGETTGTQWIVTEKQPEHNGLVVQIILVELGLINMKHPNHLITKQLI